MGMSSRALHADVPAPPDIATRVDYDAARDEMVGVMNLWPEDTGVPGIIFISTQIAAYGPRIKWWPRNPSKEGPCLVVVLEDPPRAINLGLLAPDARQGERDAVEWARLNREALLEYWKDGALWGRQRFEAFLDGLQKLP